VVSGRRRLLLVEDDSNLRAHLAELLMLEGYEVSCAGDGAEALSRLLHDAPFSVIVLDLELPRIDGFSFRAVQLQSPALREIPTIAFTSVRDPEKLPRFDFDAVIPKGTAFEPLMSTLAAVCPPSANAA
jgi:CheY-like chemotaxis protein